MMENRKCVIFGAGERGTNIFHKLSISFDVVAFADNNKSLWGQQRNGVAIIPPDDLPQLVKDTGASVFIANELHYLDIAEQLDGYGLSYYNCEGYFCYKKGDGVWYPVSLGRPAAYRKPDKEKFAVLFVQTKPCTRTNKIAQVLKERGVFTCSAYTAGPSDAGDRAFFSEFPFWTYSDLLDFVNESEFDIIHCSNEPDTLVSLLVHSNKKVIHDCHDVITLAYGEVSSEQAALEYLANTQADGIMCTTEGMRDVLDLKYGVSKKETLVVGNYPLSSFGRVERLPKLSAADGEIHCVYEGGIIDRAGAANVPYRFFEPMFLQLAELGVHVHIYSPSAPEYLKGLAENSPRIHYEGNYSGVELIGRMTQYDLGFLLFPGNAVHLTTASPNKMTEYLAAGLPAVTNVAAYAKILTETGGGGPVDLARDDVVSKLREYRKISIPPDFCDTHGLTMDAHAERILNFYKKVIGR